MKLVALGFLIFSSAIVITLIQSIFKLLNFDFDKNPLSLKVIYTIFRLPILFVLLFVLFIVYGVPFLEEL